MAREVVWHVGWPKTATTSLQQAFRSFPNLSGRPFDRPGGQAAEQVHLAVRSTVAPPRRLLADHLERSHIDPDRPVIHSDEGFVAMPLRHWYDGFSQPSVLADRVGAASEGWEPSVLFTLRSPCSLLRSHYRYSVRGGYPYDYARFLDRVIDDVDAGRGPFDLLGIADAYERNVGAERICLAWMEDLIADHAAFWDGISCRLGLDSLRELGAAPLGHANEARVGPPWIELPLNRWVLTSATRPRHGLRVIPRSRFRSAVTERVFHRSSNAYFRRGEEQEARLVGHLETAIAELRRRYSADRSRSAGTRRRHARTPAE